MKVIIDRFENNFAVVETEDKQFVNFPRQLVPTGAGEGSVLTINLDVGGTEQRRAKIADLMDKVWKD